MGLETLRPGDAPETAAQLVQRALNLCNVEDSITALVVSIINTVTPRLDTGVALQLITAERSGSCCVCPAQEELETLRRRAEGAELARDDAEQRFRDAWQERTEFAKRIDIADAEVEEQRKQIHDLRDRLQGHANDATLAANLQQAKADFLELNLKYDAAVVANNALQTKIKQLEVCDDVELLRLKELLSDNEKARNKLFDEGRAMRLAIRECYLAARPIEQDANGPLTAIPSQRFATLVGTIGLS
jgi:hypothetical protein